MRNRLFSTIIIVIFILSQGLCACSQEPVPKSSFGEVDALQDGAVLSYGNGVRDGEGQNEDTVQATTSDTPIKTAKSVDVDSLPAGIERMVGMCDAINMACVEMREQYGVDDSDFVWDCVHLYVANCRDRKMGFKAVAADDFCGCLFYVREDTGTTDPFREDDFGQGRDTTGQHRKQSQIQVFKR